MERSIGEEYFKQSQKLYDLDYDLQLNAAIKAVQIMTTTQKLVRTLNTWNQCLIIYIVKKLTKKI